MVFVMWEIESFLPSKAYKCGQYYPCNLCTVFQSSEEDTTGDPGDSHLLKNDFCVCFAVQIYECWPRNHKLISVLGSSI